jgi:hypothetical protein
VSAPPSAGILLTRLLPSHLFVAKLCLLDNFMQISLEVVLRMVIMLLRDGLLTGLGPWGRRSIPPGDGLGRSQRSDYDGPRRDRSGPIQVRRLRTSGFFDQAPILVASLFLFRMIGIADP